MKLFLLPLVLLPFLVGCVDTQTRTKVERFDRGLADVRRQLAEQSADIDTLRADLQAVQGRLDEITHTQGDRQGALSELARDLSSLKRRLPPPPEVPVKLLEEDEARLGDLPTTAQPLLDDAFLRLREGRYSEAEAKLQEVMVELGESEQVVVPLFWLGVAYEGLKEWRKALGAYADLTEKFPKSPRAPAALLRQSAAFRRLGDANAARLTLQKLVAQFPKSAEASQAREQLKKR